LDGDGQESKGNVNVSTIRLEKTLNTECSVRSYLAGPPSMNNRKIVSGGSSQDPEEKGEKGKMPAKLKSHPGCERK